MQNYPNFPWAVNPLKVTNSFNALTDRKKSDSRVVINEETLKEEYIKRGGLLTQYKPSIVAGKIVRPEVPTAAEQLKMEAEEKAAAIAAESTPNDVETEDEVKKEGSKKGKTK